MPPQGLPSTPRATRPALSPLHTTFPSTPAPPPYSTQPFKPSDSIFANATIPLSPASSSASSSSSSPYDGLAPRKRNPIVRLFSCFGREERARRRVERAEGFEKVGEGGHWTEC
ncbi:hypothetical protein P153DRAFT_398254 [Dothidotthia symphoricarpi CBS 119687]|uniref:Uncharacterized protein n=1 Tax=Dothidotthia symphoricarpi CBS 119687 TaxID=1392245 RepID=A0A6A6A9X1_9PLEO|nr:uncharacterized protein P153DRAFT_398254 [Dothidotthia symphoricarpi CBS 119687]KAF2127658.1 hypothetical protein P153DRAFT_398254 [Dothidotthia symphoricarpi CBS 119687]